MDSKKKLGIKSKTFKNLDFLFVVLFTLGLFLFVYLTCTPRAFSDDDWGIANYFAGVIDVDYATPYNKFINFIWGWIMYGMYQLLPGPNWFVVIQELIVIFSFALMHFLMIQKLKEYISIVWCYLFSSAIIVAFEPSYICRLTFTQTAVLGSIIGIILMIYSYEKHFKLGYIIGIILTVVSALYRFGSFEMCMPFAGLLFVDFTLRRTDRITIKDIASIIRKDKRLYLTFVGIIVCCFAASKINVAIYNSDYYADYNSFNAARASVLDYPKAPYEIIADELEEIGVSENDYSLIISWNIADLSFVTTDLLKSIAEVEPKVSTQIDYGQEIRTFFEKLFDPTIMYNKLFYLVLIILVLCLLFDFRHMFFFAFSLLLSTISIEIYFTVFVKRYPEYVRTGLLFAVIVTALFITNFEKIRRLQGKNVISAILWLVMVFGLSPLGDEYYLQTKGTFEYNMDGLAMYEYMNGRKDDIFIIPTGESGGLPALRDSYSIFQGTKSGIMWHTVGLGGWSTNNPWVNEAYSSWGIDYPMSQTADENVYLLASPGKVRSLQQYLLEHRAIRTTAALSAVEYGTTIYKITDKDLQAEENSFAVLGAASAEYDDVYGTYDISVYFDYIGDFEEHNRVFVSLMDSNGDTGYYMVYGGNDITLKPGRNSLLAKIPLSELDAKMVYSINLMVQTRNDNYKNCDKTLKLHLPKATAEE